MRVVQLQAQNVKRLKAIDITPTEDVVVIAGRNAQGKSSVLDSIWWALGGKRSFSDSPEPVRHGERKARATVDLGEMVVTRTWTADGGTTLSVIAKDGTKFTSPQELLDRLIGSLAFDPLAFANMDPRLQRRTLLGMVELPFDLDEIDRRRQAIFDRRTAANRDWKRLQGSLDSLPKPVAVYGPVGSMDEALAELRAASEVKAGNDAVRLRYEKAQSERVAAAIAVRVAEEALLSAKRQLDAADGVLAARFDELNEIGPDPDMDALQAAVSEADARREEGRAVVEYERRQAEVDDARVVSEDLTGQLAAIDAEKLTGLQAAAMPIPGLFVADDAVLFNDVALAQCSGAERLRVSLAIAMASNPELRVCHIKDGSLLDDESLELVREMAAFEDFQVWLEMVDSSGQIGIVIEDGVVVAVNGVTS